MEYLGIFIAVIIALFVSLDAKKRYKKNSPAPLFWFFGVLLLLIVFLPAYLIVRPPIASAVEPKLCAHCGKYYEKDPLFCPNCGNKLI